MHAICAAQNHFRFVKINHSPWRRALELLILVLIYSTLIIVLPDAVGAALQPVESAGRLARATEPFAVHVCE